MIANSDAEIQLLILPGLGADSRIIHYQRTLPFEVISHDYIDWRDGESLQAYSERFYKHLLEAQVIDLRRPVFIGGMSLGGVIAQEISLLTPVSGVILLGSLETSEELVPFIRWFGRVVAHRLPHWVYVASTPLVPIVMRRVSRISERDVNLALSMYRGLPPHFFLRAFHALSLWKGPSRPVSAPMLRVHGVDDQIVPSRRVRRADKILNRAKHLVALAEPEAVNREIEDFVHDIVAGGRNRTDSAVV